MPYPWLPFKFVEAIVAETWLMPLAPRERIAFMTSAPLVSRAWLSTYSRRHVHIPSWSYLDCFLAMLNKDYPLDVCQSITFSTDVTHRHAYSSNKPFINLLYAISPFRLPKLHIISLIYTTSHPDEFLADLTYTLNVAPFPPQITSFELTLADPERPTDRVPCRRLVWPLPPR